MAMGEIRDLLLDSVRIDPGLQPRVAMDREIVTEYAEAMEAGDAFPAIIVFDDGACFWLADGWHRVEAARSVRDKRTILAEVREGTRRDALLYSLGANAVHGLRRSNADKRKAVERVLLDPEWVKWSDREIARVCRVGHPLVAGVRKAMHLTGIDSSERTFTTKHGTVATMNTAPIAAANEAREAAPESVRTEPAATEPRDGGVDGWTSDYGNDPERYAPIWRLEQAVNQYLDVRHGIRAAADENPEVRLRTLEMMRSAGFDMVYTALKPHIEQRWLYKDLKQALNNVIEQHRQKIERKGPNPWAPSLTPVTREEPDESAEPEPEPELVAPREPSVWAPDLTPEKHEPQEPFLDDIELTVKIVGARNPADRKVSASAKTYKHRCKMIDQYYGRPPIGLSELYAEIAAVLGAVLEQEALALAGSQPEPSGQPLQAGPFPVGSRTSFSGKTGTLIAWKANGRTAEIEDDSGRRYTMPAFMVQAIEAEPA